MTIYLPSLLDKFKDFVNGIKANWQEYEAHVDNTTDAHGIDVIAEDLADHAAETATDNVHGLAGKIIEESGSNENGSYVRFSNGLQVCWLYVEETLDINKAAAGGYRSTESTHALPATFVVGVANKVPVVCATSGTLDALVLRARMLTSDKGESCRLVFWRANSAANVSCGARITVFGWWK